MPDDITGAATTWATVTPAQNETWQVVLGQARISQDTTPPLATMPLASGLLLKAQERIDVTSGAEVRYRRVGSAPLTIGRSRR